MIYLKYTSEGYINSRMAKKEARKLCCNVLNVRKIRKMNPAENLIFQQTLATPRHLFHSRPAKFYYYQRCSVKNKT
jgi:hypothetical protein